MATELELKIERFKTDIETAHSIIHGDAAAVVETEGGNVKSLAKLVKDAEDEFVAPAITAAEAARDETITARDVASGAAISAASAASDAVTARTAAEAARDETITARDVASGAATSATSAASDAATARTGAEAARDAAVAAAGAAAVVVAGSEIDLTLGGWFMKTFEAGVIALTTTGWPPSGTVASIIFEVENAGLATITWPAGWHWAGGIEPAWSSDATDIIVAVSRDGGTTVYAGCMIHGLAAGT